MEITDNTELNRYELRKDGKLAGVVEYERGDQGPVVLLHTEVLPEYKGQGVGGRLARGTLDEIRARGGKVVPVCPFIEKWIGRHPEYGDLVA